jgi:hypothetical protein
VHHCPRVSLTGPTVATVVTLCTSGGEEGGRQAQDLGFQHFPPGLDDVDGPMEIGPSAA